MDYFTQKRTLWLIIGLLIVLNLGTITTIWIISKPAVFAKAQPEKVVNDPIQISAPPPPPPPPPPPVSVQAVMSSELNLSAEQQIRFKEESEKFMKETGKVLRDYHRDKRKLMEEQASQAPDTVLLRQLTAALGHQQAELEQYMVAYFLALRESCDQQQLKKLPGVMNTILKRMSLLDEVVIHDPTIPKVEKKPENKSSNP